MRVHRERHDPVCGGFGYGHLRPCPVAKRGLQMTGMAIMKPGHYALLVKFATHLVPVVDLDNFQVMYAFGIRARFHHLQRSIGKMLGIKSMCVAATLIPAVEERKLGRKNGSLQTIEAAIASHDVVDIHLALAATVVRQRADVRRERGVIRDHGTRIAECAKILPG